MNKTAIKNFAVWARITLVNAVTQMAFEYDVTENGKNDFSQVSVNGRTLTNAEKYQRERLILSVRQYGFSQTMEEAAYTWFNRFIALRFMEVNNYLPSHTRIFSDENGNFKPEVLDTAATLSITKKVNGEEVEQLDRELVLEMLENQENERLYKYIIITQCNALNEGLPEMFEDIDGWTELLFPRNLLREDSVIAKMVQDIPEEDWKDQVQIIGWLYQYYNTELKEQVFADLKKNIKISANAIPAATQLFTPDWIVRYMVENSLGRLWVDGHGKPQNADWKYYLDEAQQEESVIAELQKIRAGSQNIQPEQIKIIDPCMGSGHILVYAFDVLMDIYTSCGFSEREAAKSILRHNLYGLDIDRRAYQLAYFSVMMKARQFNRRILTAENQPNLANFADAVCVDKSMLSGEVREFAEQFDNADTYGSLMPAPADFGDISESAGHQIKMMKKIQMILSQKYDVVCTNPPYMGSSGMNAVLSDFVKKNYPDAKSDLFACFIERGLSLTKSNGYNCMVTMQSWMFLSSFEKMRVKIINNNTISALMHMENMVMGIAFGTAVSVIQKCHIKGFKGTYNHIKLENIVDSLPVEFPVAGNRFAQVSSENFSKIPGSPVAYWVSENFVRAFEVGKPLGEFGRVSEGVKTGNNDKFLKLWFEVPSNKFSFGDESRNRKWYPHHKGGDYRKWYGNLEYVINWENDGKDIKESKNSGLQGKDMYFKTLICWSKITSKGSTFRYIPKNCLFDSGSPAYWTQNNIKYVLGFLNVLGGYMLNIFNPTLNCQVGDVKGLPIIFDENKKPVVDKLVQENINISKTDWDSFETSWDFKRHPLI